MADFGDIIETKAVPQEGQLDTRKYGDSTVKYEGTPTAYHAGDLVHYPYSSGETSSMEAIGLAWSGYINGIAPS